MEPKVAARLVPHHLGVSQQFFILLQLYENGLSRYSDIFGTFPSSFYAAITMKKPLLIRWGGRDHQLCLRAHREGCNVYIYRNMFAVSTSQYV